MNSAIERAMAHYAPKLDDVRAIEVPEWGVTIYVKPANLAVRDKLYQASIKHGLSALADTLILRALNEDGMRVFKPVDRVHLLNEVDPDVLTRVASEINDDLDGLTDEAITEEAGNSEATATDSPATD